MAGGGGGLVATAGWWLRQAASTMCIITQPSDRHDLSASSEIFFKKIGARAIAAVLLHADRRSCAGVALHRTGRGAY